MSVKTSVLRQREVMSNFPKVELHRHLEGTFNLEMLYRIAVRNDIDVPKDFETFKLNAQFPKNHPPDFVLFLSKFRNDWYRNYKDIEDLIYHSVKDFQKDNIYFIELRFSPEHFSLRNDFNRVEVTKLILNTANAAAKDIGIGIKYIITFNRNKQDQHEMLGLYHRILDAGFTDIVGMDLAGNEELNPAQEFTDVFDRIKKEGKLGITIHAGEVTPPEQVWQAIDLLHADRIGHGTASIKDVKLQKVLIERKIYLEQCPVSNHFTGAWEDTPSHPFYELNKNKVLVTLNSDDPTVQNTTLTDDFVAAVEFYHQDLQGLINLNIRALEGSFASDKEKKVRIKGYKKAVSNFVASLGWSVLV